MGRHAESFKDYFLAEISRHKHSTADLKAVTLASTTARTTIVSSGAIDLITKPQADPMQGCAQESKEAKTATSVTKGTDTKCSECYYIVAAETSPSMPRLSKSSSVNLEDPTTYCLICSLYVFINSRLIGFVPASRV